MEFKPSELDFFFDRKNNIRLGSTKDFIVKDDTVTLPLVSARISRLYEHLKSGMPVMFITSDRYYYTNREKQTKREELVRKIKDAGLSFTKLAGAWQDPNYPLTYETSFMVVGYNHKTGEEMNLMEFAKLANKWCIEFNQTSTIVGSYNEETNKYDFTMFGYVYDDEGNIKDRYEVKFENIAFDTPENIEKFHGEYIEEKLKNDKEYEDPGFGYSKTKTKSRPAFVLRDKDETEFANKKKGKVYAQVNLPRVHTFSNRRFKDEEKINEGMYSLDLVEQMNDNKYGTKTIIHEVK